MTEPKIDIAAELAAMDKMTAKMLRAKYEDLFGEPCRSGNRQWLLRRCAWRLQSQVEGTLSERAQRKAEALARDADIRVIPPAEMRPAPQPAAGPQPVRKYFKHQDDPRLPMPGATLRRVYRGKEYVVEVLPEGFAYDGQRYRSLSAVAHAITGSHWNGYRCFNILQRSEDVNDRQ